MMNSSRSSSLSVSPAYQTAMGDLAKLLEDTGSSVQSILSKYSAACVKPSGPEVLDMRTSLSIGITPSLLNNIGHTSPSEAHNLLLGDDVSGSGLRPSPFQNSASKAAHHQHDVQNRLVRKQPEKSGHGKPTNGLSLKEGGTLSDEDALRVFLEEIKKTIGDWLARQKVLVQNKAASTSRADVAHGEVAVRSPLHLPNGAPLPLGFEKEHSPAVNKGALGGVNPVEKEASVPRNEKEKEEEKKGCVPLQQDKEAGHSLIEAEQENSVRLDKVVDGIASQLLQSDDEGSHQELEQSTETQTQNPTEKEDAAQVPPGVEQAQNPSEKEDAGQVPPAAQICVEKAAALATEGNAASSPASKEVTPVTDSFITPTKTDHTESKLSLTEWKPPTSAAKTKDKKMPFPPRAVEVIDSPDWLPQGWVTELKTRGSGNSAGSKDKYYVDPMSNRRFRSRKEVIAFLERSKPKLGDSPETSPIKLLGPELLPSPPPKRSHHKKKAKITESSVPSSSALPPQMVPSIASPGLLGNMFIPPFRTGQPSEWLVYESLASLPFPMFDPFYYADFGANKSSSSKGSHIPARPWFFSGPEASWSPFMDRASLGKSGEGRDYHNYFSMPPYPSEAAPKPSTGGNKKSSSKRKSADS
eukprot:c21329_g1_i2 orf=528-2447(-)